MRSFSQKYSTNFCVMTKFRVKEEYEKKMRILGIIMMSLENDKTEKMLHEKCNDENLNLKRKN